MRELIFAWQAFSIIIVSYAPKMNKSSNIYSHANTISNLRSASHFIWFSTTRLNSILSMMCNVSLDTYKLLQYVLFFNSCIIFSCVFVINIRSRSSHIRTSNIQKTCCSGRFWPEWIFHFIFTRIFARHDASSNFGHEVTNCYACMSRKYVTTEMIASLMFVYSSIRP